MEGQWYFAYKHHLIVAVIVSAWLFEVPCLLGSFSSILSVDVDVANGTPSLQVITCIIHV